MEKSNNQQTENQQTETENPNAGGVSAIEQQFITNYIKTGKIGESVKMIPDMPKHTDSTYCNMGSVMLNKPRVQAEIKRIMDELKKESIATADEVMKFFTSVMRGEVKDQFGLDATLSDRTRAAQEIARRTIDIENRNAGNADQTISITLDWARDKN